MEGVCFVMTGTEFLREKSKAITKLSEMGSGSLKASPWSMALWMLPEPLDPVTEGIFYLEIDLTDRVKAKQNLDVMGRYSRPYLLGINVTGSRALLSSLSVLPSSLRCNGVSH